MGQVGAGRSAADFFRVGVGAFGCGAGALGRTLKGVLKPLLAALLLVSPAVAPPAPAAAFSPAGSPQAAFLPAGSSQAAFLPAASSPAAHIVRPGDTLSGIARQYHVTVGELRRWNDLGTTDVIRPDAALRLSDSDRARPAWSTWSETLTAAEANGDPKKKCPVAAADLRRVWVKYTDFDGHPHDGSLIVSRTIVPATQKAFALLYKWRFPIMVMEPVTRNLPGLTDRTVLTSGYECRNVAGTTKWSQHAYGLAIDVNPRQNPMIRGTYLDPPHSEPWIPRTPYRTGMIHAGGAETAFTTNGFSWGGRWKSLKDYMHFSPNNL